MIAPRIKHFINLSIASLSFPKQLKIAKVTLLLKGGDREYPGNNRRISILPTLSKIFEKHVTSDMKICLLFIICVYIIIIRLSIRKTTNCTQFSTQCKLANEDKLKLYIPNHSLVAVSCQKVLGILYIDEFPKWFERISKTYSKLASCIAQLRCLKTYLYLAKEAMLT